MMKMGKPTLITELHLCRRYISRPEADPDPNQRGGRGGAETISGGAAGGAETISG